MLVFSAVVDTDRDMPDSFALAEATGELVVVVGVAVGDDGGVTCLGFLSTCPSSSSSLSSEVKGAKGMGRSWSRQSSMESESLGRPSFSTIHGHSNRGLKLMFLLGTF